MGTILLVKAYLLWRGSRWGFWLSLVLMLVTAIIALLGAYPLVLYSAANLLVLLPSSRKYLSGRAEAPPEPPYEEYELEL